MKSYNKEPKASLDFKKIIEKNLRKEAYWKEIESFEEILELKVVNRPENLQVFSKLEFFNYKVMELKYKTFLGDQGYKKQELRVKILCLQ